MCGLQKLTILDLEIFGEHFYLFLKNITQCCSYKKHKNVIMLIVFYNQKKGRENVNFNEVKMEGNV